MTPLEAIDHCQSIADEASLRVTEAKMDLSRVQSNHFTALESGQFFEHKKIREAEEKLAGRMTEMELVLSQTEEARSLASSASASARLSSSQAELDYLLKRFPLELSS